MGKIKKWFNSRNNLLAILIALLVMFAGINIFIPLIDRRNFSLSYIILLGLAITCLAILVIIFITDMFDKLRVILNKINITIFKSIIIIALIFLVSYAYLETMNHKIAIANLSGKGIWGVVVIVCSILVFGLNTIRKIQILEVKIILDNPKFKDECPIVSSDDTFKIQALCNGNNADIIKFCGFCFSDKVDEILYSINQDWEKSIWLPKINSGHSLYTINEKVQPHSLSREYSITGKSIIDVLEDKCSVKGYIGICALYMDSNGIYYYAPLLIDAGDKSNMIVNNKKAKKKKTNIYWVIQIIAVVCMVLSIYFWIQPMTFLKNNKIISWLLSNYYPKIYFLVASLFLFLVNVFLKKYICEKILACVIVLTGLAVLPPVLETFIKVKLTVGSYLAVGYMALLIGFVGIYLYKKYKEN